MSEKTLSNLELALTHHEHSANRGISTCSAEIYLYRMVSLFLRSQMVPTLSAPNWLVSPRIARQQQWLLRRKRLSKRFVLLPYGMAVQMYGLAESLKILFHKTKRVVTRQPHPSLTTPTVQAILANPGRQLRWPSKHDKGTPLETLYLMYYCFVRGDVVRLQSLVRGFCDRHEWKVQDIPDPQDSDPERWVRRHSDFMFQKY